MKETNELRKLADLKRRRHRRQTSKLLLMVTNKIKEAVAELEKDPIDPKCRR